jgi:hypothetical protein
MAVILLRIFLTDNLHNRLVWLMKNDFKTGTFPFHKKGSFNQYVGDLSLKISKRYFYMFSVKHNNLLLFNLMASFLNFSIDSWNDLD